MLHIFGVVATVYPLATCIPIYPVRLLHEFRFPDSFDQTAQQKCQTITTENKT